MEDPALFHARIYYLSPLPGLKIDHDLYQGLTPLAKYLTPLRGRGPRVVLAGL